MIRLRPSPLSSKWTVFVFVCDLCVHGVCPFFFLGLIGLCAHGSACAHAFGVHGYVRVSSVHASCFHDLCVSGLFVCVHAPCVHKFVLVIFFVVADFFFFFWSVYIEYFVENNVCKLRVVLRSRVLRRHPEYKVILDTNH